MRMTRKEMKMHTYIVKVKDVGFYVDPDKGKRKNQIKQDVMQEVMSWAKNLATSQKDSVLYPILDSIEIDVSDLFSKDNSQSYTIWLCINYADPKNPNSVAYTQTKHMTYFADEPLDAVIKRLLKSLTYDFVHIQALYNKHL